MKSLLALAFCAALLCPGPVRAEGQGPLTVGLLLTLSGPGAVLGSLVSKWLPTETAKIEISRGDHPEVTVGGIGHAKLELIKDQAGKQAAIMNAPILGLIEISKAELARSDGSRFAGPEMRSWDAGGHGSVNPFRWKA